MCVHENGIEITDPFAISQTEASPAAPPSAARYQGSGTATFQSPVGCPRFGDMVATCTGQAGHTFHLRAQIDTEEVCYDLIHFFRVDGTFARLQLTCDEFFRKGTATGCAASPAIRMGQELLNLIDARILVNEQSLAGYRKDKGEAQSKGCHKYNSKGQASKDCHIILRSGVWLQMPAWLSAYAEHTPRFSVASIAQGRPERLDACISASGMAPMTVQGLLIRTAIPA
jgi:hypothetical protein